MFTHWVLPSQCSHTGYYVPGGGTHWVLPGVCVGGGGGGDTGYYLVVGGHTHWVLPGGGGTHTHWILPGGGTHTLGTSS